MRKQIRAWGTVGSLIPTLFSALFPLGLGGCSSGFEDDSSEPLAESAEAMSEPSCLTAPIDFTNVDNTGNSRDFVDVSSETYSNASCGKARVYRLKDAFIRETGEGTGFDEIIAIYGGRRPRNQADCEASQSAIQVYTDRGAARGGTPTASQWVKLPKATRYGVWAANECHFYPARVPIEDHSVDASHPPWAYAVNATARLPDGSTTKVIVQQDRCGRVTAPSQVACANQFCSEGVPILGSGSGGTICAARESRTITFPTLQAGSVDVSSLRLVINNDGTWQYTGHAHSSAFFPMDYRVGVASAVTLNGHQFGVQRTGGLGGTTPSLDPRSEDFSMSGNDSRLSRDWIALRSRSWSAAAHSGADPWLTGLEVITGLGLVVLGVLFIGMETDDKCTDWRLEQNASDGSMSMRKDCP
jgi:hypothetical protein